MRIGFYNFAFAAVAASVAVGVFADDAAGALRTVTEFFPLMTTWAGGRVRRIRREDGRVDEYGYSMEGGVWTEKVTHLHESADAHVEGRTTRDFTLTNGRGETVETRTEAYVGGECVGIAFFDGTSRVVSATNRADHARTFARFGCNGTCWQTACGVYAGLQLLAAARPGESLTVSSAMRLAPYRTIVADAMARVGEAVPEARVGFAIEVRDDFIAADAIRADVLPLFGNRAEKDLLA